MYTAHFPLRGRHRRFLQSALVILSHHSRDYDYRVCSFTILGMASFLLRAALKLHFIPNGQFIITFFFSNKNSQGTKAYELQRGAYCVNREMISCDAKLHVPNT